MNTPAHRQMKSSTCSTTGCGIVKKRRLGISRVNQHPVTEFEIALNKVQAHLEGLSRKYALVGGFAIGVRADPRFTQDLDLAVSTQDDSDAESLIMDFHRAGYALIATVEQEGVGRLATARLVCPHTKLTVDLLFASSGIEPEIADDADVLNLTERLQLPVAKLGHLLATKVLSRDDSRRPQDRMDLASLFKKADESQIQLARESLFLMRARGYQRDKNLPEAFWAAFWDLHLTGSKLSVWDTLPLGLLEVFDKADPEYLKKDLPAHKITADFCKELHMFPGVLLWDLEALNSHLATKTDKLKSLSDRGLVTLVEARELLEGCPIEDSLRSRPLPN